MKIAYIDECKQPPYILVMFMLSPVQLASFRKLLIGFRLQGQRSVHFATESPRRRRLILKSLLDFEVDVLVYRSRFKKGNKARETLLRRIVSDAEKLQIQSVFLDYDSTTVKFDNQVLRHWLSLSRSTSWPLWDHLERHQEPLLWVPDAVAWCLNRGGEWARMVQPMIVETIDC